MARKNTELQLVIDETDIEESLPIAELLSFRLAMKNQLKTGIPIVATFGLLSGFYTINDLIAKATSISATQGYPIIFTITANSFGIIKGFLSTPHVISGELLQQKELTTIGILRRGNLLVATALAPIAMGSFFAIGPTLNALGIDPSIVDEIAGYYLPLAIASPLLCALLAEQQIVISLGQSRLFLASGISFIAASAAIGYPLALGWLGLPNLGMEGIGIGIASSVTINFLLFQLYFAFRESFKPYAFFKTNIKELFSDLKYFVTHFLKEYGKIGSLFATQAVVEWLSLGLIYLYIALHFDKTTNLAADVMFQLIMGYNIISTSIMFTNRILIAPLSQALLDNPHIIHLKNIKLQGRVNLLTGIGAALVVDGLMVIPPVLNALTHLFVDMNALSDSEQDAVQSMTQTLAYINMLRFLFDSVRTGIMGNMAGQRQLLRPTLYNLFFITILASALGIIGDEFFDLGAEWLFLSQAIGIGCAGGAMAIESLWQNRESSIETNANDSYCIEVEDIESRNSDYQQNNRYSWFCCNTEESDTTIQEQASSGNVLTPLKNFF